MGSWVTEDMIDGLLQTLPGEAREKINPRCAARAIENAIAATPHTPRAWEISFNDKHVATTSEEPTFTSADCDGTPWNVVELYASSHSRAADRLLTVPLIKLLRSAVQALIHNDVARGGGRDFSFEDATDNALRVLEALEHDVEASTAAGAFPARASTTFSGFGDLPNIGRGSLKLDGPAGAEAYSPATSDDLILHVERAQSVLSGEHARISGVAQRPEVRCAEALEIISAALSNARQAQDDVPTSLALDVDEALEGLLRDDVSESDRRADVTFARNVLQRLRNRHDQLDNAADGRDRMLAFGDVLVSFLCERLGLQIDCEGEDLWWTPAGDAPSDEANEMGSTREVLEKLYVDLDTAWGLAGNAENRAERATDALQWYAEPQNWRDGVPGTSGERLIWNQDNGRRARTAIAGDQDV